MVKYGWKGDLFTKNGYYSKNGKISYITVTDGLYYIPNQTTWFWNHYVNVSLMTKVFEKKIANCEESWRQTQIYGISTVLNSFLMKNDVV